MSNTNNNIVSIAAIEQQPSESALRTACTDFAAPNLSVSETANLWNLSEDTVSRTQSGVLKIGTAFKREKRGYVVLRIPESVLQRVLHETLRGQVQRG